MSEITNQSNLTNQTNQINQIEQKILNMLSEDEIPELVPIEEIEQSKQTEQIEQIEQSKQTEQIKQIEQTQPTRIIPKQGRNEMCACNSGKKYKKCCESLKPDKIVTKTTKYQTGQLESSENITECLEILRDAYPNYKYIDITNDLTQNTYKDYQLRNMNSNIVMLAERTLLNESVFKSRVNSPDSNLMVMYHGSFRTFDSDMIYNYLASLKTMLK
jgi:hypothetical protein